ncbi:MAG: alpha/beta fold hydrolase [Gammaproteobacteria bacterium]|nr:alpha/beta fold hydrolase [Gammaproteobacteria bacterium]MCP5137911.1 alpha/beta fold hydrolase [Gammaproteobacteria bacterium]
MAMIPGMNSTLAIVIVHGMLGFGRIQALRTGRIYFSGLSDALGEDVYFPALPGNGRIVDRARTLAEFLDTLPHDHIAIIAHSMGGLDARHLIQHLDLKHRVRELITLSTPHHGSAIADIAQDSGSPTYAIVRALTRPALDDLCSDACDQFNRDTPNRADVRYRSYTASRPIAQMPVWLRPFARVFGTVPNDGLVSVDSGKWGEHIETLTATHFELAGWRVLPIGAWRVPRFEHIGFYRKLVADLRTGDD